MCIRDRVSSARPPEAVVERIAGPAHGTDRVGHVAAIDRLAQPADMHVHGALVDIDIAAPDAVEQLLAREHPARALHQELQQTAVSYTHLRAHETRHDLV